MKNVVYSYEVERATVVAAPCCGTFMSSANITGGKCPGCRVAGGTAELGRGGAGSETVTGKGVRSRASMRYGFLLPEWRPFIKCRQIYQDDELPAPLRWLPPGANPMPVRPPKSVDSKKCSWCGRTFYRNSNGKESKSRWDNRRACSQRCGLYLSGGAGGKGGRPKKVT